jgi:cyclophilin family peptidyl-prolyl cis-trans isomerase
MTRLVFAGGLALLLQAGVASADSTSTTMPPEKVRDTPPAEAPKEPTAAPVAAPKAGTATKTRAARAGGSQVAVLETSKGKIVIRLFDKDAPKTAANFRKLVSTGFYNGTYFHRVIPGFMIQGGDPNTKDTDPNNDGMGGPSYTVPAEIKLKHLRGSVATARTGDAVNPQRASSGSQFFIDLAPQASLDAGGYTVFGEVIQGMDVVDQIAALATAPGTLQAQAGPNPQRKATILKAYLAPAPKAAAASSATTGTTH